MKEIQQQLVAGVLVLIAADSEAVAQAGGEDD
jgi:hypothetical protein